MSFLRKSIILIVLVYVGHDLTGRGLSLYENSELVNGQTGMDFRYELSETGIGEEQILSLPSFYLIILIVICILFICTLYKVNKLTRRLSGLDPVLVAKKRDLKGALDQTDTIPVGSDEEQLPAAVTAKDLKWLEKLDELIKNELSNTLLKPLDLAEHMGVCERQLQRKLKELKGISPARYLKQARLEMGREYLQSGDFQTVSEVAYKVGYKSLNNFSRSFKSFFGMNPNDLLNTIILV